ncbi:MAG: hypothetical protein IJ292_00910 [Clostridia bacterium]|nr:hypothetical protein [Clostridia bacterium]
MIILVNKIYETGIVVMSDNRIKFRKSMSGYNREDVNNYIESISSKNYESEEAYKKKIADLEAKVKELEKENKEYEENVAAEAEKLRAEKEQGECLILELNEALDKLKTEKNGLIQENTQLKERVSELEKANESNIEAFEKSDKYDKVSGQIGSVLLNANARAESIVSEAQIKARMHMASMVDRTAEKLRILNEKYTKQITMKTVGMTEELRELSLSAESFRIQTQNALETECRELKETLEETKRIILEGDNE